MSEAAPNTTIAFLRRRAGWSIVVYVVLLILTLALGVLIIISTSINLFYHPHHPQRPYDRELSNVTMIAGAVAIAAVVVPSIALWRRYRLFAVLSGISIWVVFLAGAAIDLALVKPGPATYEMSVGNDRFAVPWQFAPRADPATSGFSVTICKYNHVPDIPCRDRGSRSQMTLLPGRALSNWVSRENLGKTTARRPEGDAYEHQAFAWNYPNIPSTTSGSQATGQASRYFVRFDASGQAVRTVNCSADTLCVHEILAGQLTLRYFSNTDLSRWAAMDSEVAALVDSWRIK